MNTDFAQLNVDGAAITECRVEPLRKIVMTLLLGPEYEAGRKVQKEMDLQFNSVKDFRIQLESEPFPQIVSHAVFLETEYLRTFVANLASHSEGEKLAHFEIICGSGRFDIIARNFTLSEFHEIPYATSATEPNE